MRIPTTYIRSVSTLAILVFLGIGIHPILIGGIVDHNTIFQFIIIGCLASFPLVYDVFRHTSVRYYVLTVSACAVLLSVITIIGDPYLSLTIAASAILMSLFSTVWIRTIRIFYGIISTTFFISFALFIYAYTYGHYGVNPFDPTNWHWSEVVSVLAVIWLLFRSWCLSTYTMNNRE